MKLDLEHVPFSRFGAYLAVSSLPDSGGHPAGLYLRTLHGGMSAYTQPMMRLELLVDGAPRPFQAEAGPARLTLRPEADPEAAQVQLCFAEPNILRVRGEGAGLRLHFPTTGSDYVFQVDEQRWQFNCVSWDVNFMFTALIGDWQVDAPWATTHSERLIFDLLPDPTGECEAAIEEFETVWNPHGYPLTFEEAAASVETEFQQWLDQIPALPDEYAEARRLAGYILWSSVVEPAGHINWPAIYMSKNWMSSVWSWDHCFNAMALTYKRPVLGWDQIRVIFDQQDIYGCLPDLVSDRSMVWSFVKPPIHGWALGWMMDRTSFIRREQLHQIYGPLCSWTEWWFAHRDYDHDGIPQYNHGNNSGWDNATVFDSGVPLESPDLSAFLILQMETLARMAARLGNEEESESWLRRSEELLEKLLAHFWQGDHFVAMRSGDHIVSDTESLFLYLPLLLGRRLPEAIQHDLIAALTRSGRFLTAHGLATESPQSPAYRSDGYWRGPIWAPATLLMVEGLAGVGEMDLAREVARKFCDMAAAHGFAENYDALTGAGLRDRAFTWTASVFLILGHEYL